MLKQQAVDTKRELKELGIDNISSDRLATLMRMNRDLFSVDQQVAHKFTGIVSTHKAIDWKQADRAHVYKVLKQNKRI